MADIYLKYAIVQNNMAVHTIAQKIVHVDALGRIIYIYLFMNNVGIRYYISYFYFYNKEVLCYSILYFLVRIEITFGLANPTNYYGYDNSIIIEQRDNKYI